jgi:hypothetical protein
VAHWALKVDLAGEVEAYKLGNLSIEELARKVVDKFKATNWRSFSPYPHTWDDTIDRLLNVETPAEYEAAFEYIYDLADQDRVWISTY